MFNQRKHRTFNYTPRFSDEAKANDDKDSERPDFVSKWKAGSQGKRKVKGTMSIRMLILILVLLLICMYILESKFM